ncbi:TonB-dependent receptor [Flagellimonas halotolerans]|uniref:TonB-dependent receptor n=1 Tax=Flagellimonas halotolerans TaxID=3112164 RepID=A0ABU6ITE9_9FLAO|nr:MULTISPECIES: TonB-dependent receptor [unclassified Allomuricauda]MEC3966382.1 TonB-dependent receptor [Muricauda sp. SYSU M86414]MEC4266247.1 TonB-dependent receptor [Muricauda sp. SYSU M84420]
MKIKLFMILSLVGMVSIYAQNTLDITVKDSLSNEPLIGVTAVLPSLNQGTISDEAGKIHMENIPNGIYKLRLSYMGYAILERSLSFPLDEAAQGQTFFLVPQTEEMEEITLVSTRSTRTIEDIPTRVEVIAGEELSEKGNMKPGDIRMLLNESTGIRTQQTSATSYNSSIRIQGLDGKYTQLLRDGFPLYSGFASGLSLMQIAPLDLKQVEVIKGSSSTLYGGGAIAGLVNLISKTPEDEPELSFMANGTSALGLDLSGFYSQKFNKIGTTVFASYNLGTPYDPADIGLTAIPEFDRFTLNPKLYWYLGEQTELLLGFNAIWEDRLGGNMDYVKGESVSNPYFESNETERISTQLGFKHAFTDQKRLEVKNSFSFYDRSIAIPDFTFTGYQRSSFSELNFSANSENDLEWVFGANLWTEYFNDTRDSDTNALDQSYQIFGLFAQNVWPIDETFSVETGFRADFHSDYGAMALPRLSILYEPNSSLTFRLGGGMGYKTPTVFTEDAERLQFRNVLPINTNDADLERSLGGNFDVNYKWVPMPGMTMSINTLLFYTKINDPITLVPNENGFYSFQQPDGYVDTHGAEINLKVKYGDFKLFTGYTHANVKQHENGMVSDFPLVAKHRLNNVLMYEKEKNLWVGLEAYYYSPQKLDNGETGQSYWILGLMSEKKLGEKFSIFLNFENFLDTRQTRFSAIYTGNLSNPEFLDIYAPVDGFVINGGFKIKL